MKQNSHDKAWAFILIGLATVSFYAYAHPELWESETLTAKIENEIGNVASPTSGVRFRTSSNVTWEDIPSGKLKTIRLGDAIFTATQTTAVVSLLKGTKVEVQPRSLVIFNQTRPDPRGISFGVISIEKGTVRVSRPKNQSASGLFIENKGKIYQLPVSKSEETITIKIDELKPKTIVMTSNHSENKIVVTEVTLPALVFTPEKTSQAQRQSKQDEQQNSELKKSDLKPEQAAFTLLPASLVPAELPVVVKKPILVARRPSALEAPPLPLPTPKIEMIESPIDQSRSEFYLGLGQGYRKLHGIDSAGTAGNLGSGASPLLHLKWSPKLSQTWWIDFGLQFQKVSMNQSTTRLLKDTDQNINRSSVSIHHALNKTFAIRFDVGLSEELFYRSIDPVTIKIEKVSIPVALLGASYRFQNLNAMNYQIFAGYRTHLPFQTDFFKSSLSTGYVVNLSIVQQLPTFDLIGEAYYSNDHFPMEGLNLTLSELGMSLGVRFRFGNGERHD